jgi:translation initiation factor IF-2
MGMGAAKPGSTLPPQGGKSGVQQPIQPQVPMAGGKAAGAVQPGQPPYLPTGLPPSQPVYPTVGSRLPDGTLVTQQGVDQAKIMNAGKGNAPVQPTVPAQGGKFPGNPMQPTMPQPQVSPPQGGFPQRDLGYGNQLPPEVQAQINATRSNPQVSPFQGGFPQRDLGYGNQLPQGMPRPVPQVQQPAPVMPRPVPQVMPRQPTPKPAPQVMPRGLAGLRRR